MQVIGVRTPQSSSFSFGTTYQIMPGKSTLQPPRGEFILRALHVWLSSSILLELSKSSIVREHQHHDFCLFAHTVHCFFLPRNAQTLVRFLDLRLGNGKDLQTTGPLMCSASTISRAKYCSASCFRRIFSDTVSIPRGAIQNRPISKPYFLVAWYFGCL